MAKKSKRSKRSPKTPKLSVLKKKAWDWFSKYIRLKYARQDGQVECVTCKVWRPWKDMQAGHFIDGRTNAILFDERGVHPQCMGCNIFLHGNKVEYFIFMKEAYGHDVIDDLRMKRKQTLKVYPDTYERMIEHYKEEVEKSPLYE